MLRHSERLVFRNWQERHCALSIVPIPTSRSMQFFPWRRSRAAAEAKIDELAASIAQRVFAAALYGAIAALLVSTATARADTIVEGLYCGIAMSGGEHVEVRTRFTTLADGLLEGTYDFADQGKTTSGKLREYAKTSDRERTLIWVDRYGTGQLKITFDQTGGSFDGMWGIKTTAPAFRWDGKRCSIETVGLPLQSIRTVTKRSSPLFDASISNAFLRP